MTPFRFFPGRVAAFSHGCALASLVLAAALQADDTEVFFGQIDLSEDTRPNVLFVLDTSGSMNLTGNTSSEPRLARLKDAMHSILDSANDINVGIMRFNGALGGASVIEPVRPIDEVLCEGPGCDEVQTRVQVSGENRDSEERIANGKILLDGYTLTMGSTGGNGGRQIVGLSFDDLYIPQGARIVSAKIEFTADQSDSGYTALTLRAENSDDATSFSDADDDLSDRDTAGSVSWFPGRWSQGSTYESPDLSALVKTVTDRPGWCGGNALNVLIDGIGDRSAMSTRRSSERAPTLKVTYDDSDIPLGSGCMRGSAVRSIRAGGDDVGQFSTQNGQVYTGLGVTHLPRYLEGHGNRYDMVTGLRFDDLDIPPGAIVDDAWLSMSAAGESSSTAVRVKIEAQDVDNALGFPTERWSVSSLGTISPSTTWNVPPTQAEGEEMRTGDLSPLVQSILNRSGWRERNAMAFLLSAHSGDGKREFHTYEGGSAPKLHVEYRVSVGGREREHTARERLKATVSSLQATGGTPITGALYEGASYLLGRPVDYGRGRGYRGDIWYELGNKVIAAEQQGSGDWRKFQGHDFRHRYHRTSSPDSWTGGTLEGGCPSDDPSHPDCLDERIGGNPVYTSPMNGSCQANYVVLLSDGSPQANAAQRRVEKLTGESCFGTGPIDEQCGATLAGWLADTDHNVAVDGLQPITTFTVGFDLEDDKSANDFLRSLSSAGGGKHFEASNTQELINSFEAIIGDVTTADTAFVSPGATVNQFNRLTHRNDIYFAVFKPEEHVRWPGNIKRYKVADVGEDVVIRDVNGNTAVDDSAGFFAAGAQSFWSDAPDGSDVRRGGFVGELELGNAIEGFRNVYTYTGTLPLAEPVDLTLPVHALSELNPLVTDAMLDTSGEPASYRQTLLTWARGVDVEDVDGDGSTTDIRREMGDPMHSQPAILNYGDTPAENETTVFISTNQGFLHAIDPDVATGEEPADTDIGAEELFAWIPQELLGNLQRYYENEKSSAHPYGLDGGMSVWIDDRDNDLTVDSDEKAYLFVGMRRGGSNYYALDVSDRTEPKLAWVIEGGSEGFEGLGQSWSSPVPARMQIDGEQKDVVVFTGGYDTNQDPGEVEDDPDSSRYGKLPSRTSDGLGKGLYVVEMESGDLLWSGLGTTDGTKRFDDMNFSMPGSPKVVDVDVDGLADQIWASDTGGQVWRFDITPFHGGSKDGDLIHGGVMAKLGSTSDDTEARRFYYEPDIALIEKDGTRFVSVAIGSGWRAHPLNTTVDDRFYVLRSEAIYERPKGYGRYDEDSASWVPITDADLADAGDLTLDIGVDGHGWYKDLDAPGEKVLSRSLTVNNQVTFTTYLPEQGVAACSSAMGSGAVYVLDVVSGRATSDVDGDGDIDADDDSQALAHPGLPPAIVAIITEDNESGLVGTERQALDFGLLTQRTYWSNLSDSPGNADLADLLEE